MPFENGILPNFSVREKQQIYLLLTEGIADGIDRSFLLRLLNYSSGIPPLAERIFAQFYQQAKADLVQTPLKAGAVIWAHGRLRAPFHNWEERCRELCIQIQEKRPYKYSHVLLGRGNFPQDEQQPVPLLTEDNLKEALDALDPRFLDEASAQEANSLRALLESGEEQNEELAIDMLHRHGVPPAFFTYAFVSGQLHEYWPCSALRSLAALYSPPALRLLNPRVQDFSPERLAEYIAQGFVEPNEALWLAVRSSRHLHTTLDWLRPLPEALRRSVLGFLRKQPDFILRVQGAELLELLEVCPEVDRLVWAYHQDELAENLLKLPQLCYLELPVVTQPLDWSYECLRGLRALQELEVSVEYTPIPEAWMDFDWPRLERLRLMQSPYSYNPPLEPHPRWNLIENTYHRIR